MVSWAGGRCRRACRRCARPADPGCPARPPHCRRLPPSSAQLDGPPGIEHTGMGGKQVFIGHKNVLLLKIYKIALNYK